MFNRSCTNTNRKCHNNDTFQIDFQDLTHAYGGPQLCHDSLCGCENFIKQSYLIQNQTPIFVLDHESGEAWYGLTQTVEYIQDGLVLSVVQLYCLSHATGVYQYLYNVVHVSIYVFII